MRMCLCVCVYIYIYICAHTHTHVYTVYISSTKYDDNDVLMTNSPVDQNVKLWVVSFYIVLFILSFLMAYQLFRLFNTKSFFPEEQ